MSTPYHFTPRIPSAPHPTPFSSSNHKLPSVKSSRPPIHNPYDKFTQPEFDAWIGGITGALKRALGQEDEEEPIEPDTRDPTTFVHSRSHAFDDDSEISDGHIDDSFAEVKARRATGKGKARDPREGPGLGKGNSSNPIDLVSSDEEDEEDAEEVELAIAGGNELETASDEDEEEHSEEEYARERGQPSSPPLQSPAKPRRRREDSPKEVYSGDEYEEGYDEEGEQYEESEDGEEYGDVDSAPLHRSKVNDLPSDGEAEADEDNISDREPSSSPRKIRDVSLEGSEEEETRLQQSPPEVIEIDSDDEGQTDEEELPGHEMSSPPRIVRRGSYEEGDDEQGNLEGFSKGFEEYDEEEEDENEEDIAGSSQFLYSRDGPSIGRPQDEEYEYSEVIDDDEIQEIQPIEDDTSFPPQAPESPLESKTHVEIPDPWSGPRTYAEDYYSGGDAPISLGENVDVNHLGPNDDDMSVAPPSDKNMNDDDIAQPFEEDTAFPPHEEEPQVPVDISDPWEGPQTFAEDFYSGGPVQQHGGLITAHYLGPMDVDRIDDLEHDAVSPVEEAKEFEEMQPHREDTSFPEEEDVDTERAVEIPDPWIGPQTYAEDYYSGGDIRTLPGAPIDPALLSGTGDVEDDIDNFLTPGVLTPSQNDALTHSINENEDDDGAIELPYSLNTRRNAPIPEDAEILAIDDSDEEHDPNAFFEGQDSTLDDDDISFGYPEFDELQQPQQMEEVDQLDSDDIIVPPVIPSNQDDSDVAISDHQFGDEGEDNFDLEAPEDSNISVVVGQVEIEADTPQQDAANVPESGEEVEVPAVVESSSIEEVQSPPASANDTGEISVIYASEIAETASSSGPLVDVETEPALEIDEESDSVVVPPAEALPAEDLVNDLNEKEDEESTHVKLPEGTISENIAEGGDMETETATTLESSGNPNIDESGILDTALEAAQEISPNIAPETYDSDEDDIRSSSSPEPQTQPQHEDNLQPSIAVAASSATAVVSNQSQVPDQLRTQPSEKSRFVLLPPEVEDTSPTQESPETKHALDSKNKDDQEETSNDKSQQPTADAGAFEYSVVEITENDMDMYMDEDADGEIDRDNIDVRSAHHDEAIGDDSYSVEEPRTEGRLTVEPSEREMSLGVVSLGPEESAVFGHGEDIEGAENEPISPTNVLLDSAASNSEDVPSLPQGPEEVAGMSTTSEPVAEIDVVVVSADSAARQDEIPMPVTADPNVPDPTDQPLSSSNPPTDTSIDPVPEDTHVEINAQQNHHHGPSPEALAAPTQVDGLFTPAEPSVASTDEETNSRRILTEIAQYMFGTARSSPRGLNNNPSPPLHTQTPTLPDVPPLGIDSHSSPTGGGASTTEDVFGQLPSSSNGHGTDNRDNDKRDAATLSYCAPSTLMRVTLSRKPTDPVLMADPYPYCLSTPGPPMYPRHDDASEEELGLDNSMSSNSTLEKNEDINLGGGSSQVGLQYSQNTMISSVQPTPGVADSQALQNNAPLDAGQRQHAHASETRTQGDILDDLPSFASTLTGEPSKEASNSKRKRGKSSTKTTRTKKNNVNEQSAPSAAGSSLEGVAKDLPSGKQKKERKTASKSSSSSRKKKMTSYVPETTSDETILVKPRQEGKVVESTQRATSLTSTHEGSPASSSATITRQLLQFDAASSVTSPVPSNISFTSQPSPTVNRPNPLPHPTAASESLLHAHGQKRKMMLAQALQSTFSPRAQSKKPQLSRFPTAPMMMTTLPVSSPSAISPVGAPQSPTIVTPTAISPPELPSPTVSAKSKPNTPLTKANSVSSPASKFSTPVTRSHCRYHRISLPKEEGGPRVCFLVPGCSLNDKELMDEEEIVDHGDATVEDSRNMLKDIESLGFDLDLIGILRQLVGLDILREQEVFYLPQPGEVVVRKNFLQKPAPAIRAPGESSSYAGSPGGYSGSAIASPGPSRAPPSASSWSESPSISSLLRQPPVTAGKDQTESEGGITFAETDVDSESETSDDDEPTAKRARSSPEEPGVMGPPTTQAKGKQAHKSRPNKKNDPTYEPDGDHEGDESDATASARKRRKSMRGVKRSRTSDAVPSGNDGNDGKEREVKRMKSDLPAPAEPSAAPQTQLPAQ